MKKIILLVTSLLLILTFVAGCGKDERLLYNVDLSKYIEVEKYQGIEVDTDSESSTLSVKEENGELIITGDKISASFNKSTSVLTSLNLLGREVIYDKKGFEFSFFRYVDTDSDEYKKMYDNMIYSDVSAGEFFEEVDLTRGTVQLGDTVNINYIGKRNGVAFEGGTADNQELEIGSDSFIDGFEDGLIGVEIGATVDLNLTFPNPYPNNPDLAGAPVVFAVKVNGVVKRAMEIEKFYKDLNYKTVKAYEIDLKKRATVNCILDKIYNDTKVIKYSDKDIEFLYDQEISNMEKQLSAYGYGMSAEEYIETYYGMSLKEYKEESLASLQASSKQQMVLYYIFDKEKMSFTEDEKNAKINEIVEANEGVTVETVKQYYGDYYFEYMVISDKVVDFLYENAKIK